MLLRHLQVVYGCDNIKVVDARIQTQCMALDDEAMSETHAARIIEAISWAAEQGAQVITCSVEVPWCRPELQAELDRHPGIFFVAGAGDAQRAFKEEPTRLPCVHKLFNCC